MHKWRKNQIELPFFYDRYTRKSHSEYIYPSNLVFILLLITNKYIRNHRGNIEIWDSDIVREKKLEKELRNINIYPLLYR